VRKCLIRFRKERKITQQQIAEILGITRSYYGMIETGNRNPTLGLAKKIAELFQTDIDQIFFDDKSNRTLRNN
jgi:putative transcriptional regulator